MTEKRFTMYRNTIYDNGNILSPFNCMKVMNTLHNENEEFKKALMELKEIGDYQEGRIKELFDENDQLKEELEKVVEVCRKYGIYKEELQYVLADFDKMLNENGERAIRYKYCVNSKVM